MQIIFIAYFNTFSTGGISSVNTLVVAERDNGTKA